VTLWVQLLHLTPANNQNDHDQDYEPDGSNQKKEERTQLPTYLKQ
jgi:hypothetical protein